MVETLNGHQPDIAIQPDQPVLVNSDSSRMRKNGNFVLLDQYGPFRTPETIDLSMNSSWWMRNLSPEERTKYRTHRDQVLSLLEIDTLPEITDLQGDQPRIDTISALAYERLGKMYGIEGDVESVISGYAATADGVIEHVSTNVLSSYSANFEMTNEIVATSNPVDLLMIVFDDRYSQQARFEAKRKLELMHLAGAIDQRERELDLETKYQSFQDFMNKHVWDSRMKIGEVIPTFALSTHDPETFSCQDVTILSPEDAKNIDLQNGQKLTPLRRRQFVTESGKEIPVYIAMRKKDREAQILKLMRKGQENPSIAVEDDLGFMGVFDQEGDIKQFERHMTNAARKAGSHMIAEEVHDSMKGSKGKNDNPHSSKNLQMKKYFVRINGLRVEFILHTNQTYFDYRFMRDTSHGEYNVRRLFDTGVIDLLFPQEIYGIDPDKIRDQLIAEVREITEAPTKVV